MYLPNVYQQFVDSYPDVLEKYKALVVQQNASLRKMRHQFNDQTRKNNFNLLSSRRKFFQELFRLKQKVMYICF